MTMPHLMNCPHSEEHICLDCSKDNWDFQQSQIDRLENQLKLKENEMKFDNFALTAMPHVVDAYCRDCGTRLTEVSNGFLSIALFCSKCENVYALKMIKVHNPGKSYLEQCRKEVLINKRQQDIAKEVMES